MVQNPLTNKKVAYYHGCFHNYYYPEVGRATVEVLHKNNIEIIVPDQLCCALPMMAKGNYGEAHRNMNSNVKRLNSLVKKGYVVVATCSSCGLFIKQDYPHMLDTEESKEVAQNTYHITEYLLKLNDLNLLNREFRTIDQSIFYHTPCHLRAQQIDHPSVRLLKLIPGIKIIKISQECCGMGGAYGYEKINFQLSKNIARKLKEELEANPSDRIVTDCGGCKLQIEYVSQGRKADHPIIILKEAYGL